MKFKLLLAVFLIALLLLAGITGVSTAKHATATPTRTAIIVRGMTMTPGPSRTPVTYYCLQCPADAACVQICWIATLIPTPEAQTTPTPIDKPKPTRTPQCKRGRRCDKDSQ